MPIAVQTISELRSLYSISQDRQSLDFGNTKVVGACPELVSGTLLQGFILFSFSFPARPVRRVYSYHSIYSLYNSGSAFNLIAQYHPPSWRKAPLGGLTNMLEHLSRKTITLKKRLQRTPYGAQRTSRIQTALGCQDYCSPGLRHLYQPQCRLLNIYAELRC